MKRNIAVFLFALALIVALNFAQTKSGPEAAPQKESGMAGCPMMEGMAHTPGGQPSGAMHSKMIGMGGGMAGMFSLSSGEINAVLTDKKTELGLTETQAKQIADLIASSQQTKATAAVQQMMGKRSAGGMKCSCMPAATK